MDKLTQTREALKDFTARFGPAAFAEAIVEAIDANEYTADLKTSEGLVLFDCRLRAIAGGSQSLDLLPKIGSVVIIGKLADDDYLVIACDKIDSFRLVVGNSSLQVASDEIKLNGGNLGGLVKAKTLETELNKTNAVVNAILQTLQSWTPVSGDGGAAIKLALASQMAGKATGNFSNIENDKIKQ